MQNQWDQRFEADEYVYGEQPNAFIEAQAHQLKGIIYICISNLVYNEAIEKREGCFMEKLMIVVDEYSTRQCALSAMGAADRLRLAADGQAAGGTNQPKV